MNACPKYGNLLAQVATLTSAVKLEQEQQFLIAKKLQVDLLPCLVALPVTCPALSGALCLWVLPDCDSNGIFIANIAATPLVHVFWHAQHLGLHPADDFPEMKASTIPQELTGSKNIKLKPQIDESLIAGFVVEYGSSQIDLSVKGQLNKISNELVEAA